jgi:hypothetical protein
VIKLDNEEDVLSTPPTEEEEEEEGEEETGEKEDEDGFFSLDVDFDLDKMNSNAERRLAHCKGVTTSIFLATF